MWQKVMTWELGTALFIENTYKIIMIINLNCLNRASILSKWKIKKYRGGET